MRLTSLKAKVEPSRMRLLARRLDASTYRFENRLGAILILTCTSVLAAVTYWYPWYLCTYFAAPDDRYGFVLVGAMPWWFIGPAVAARAAIRLWKTIRTRKPGAGNLWFAFLGSALSLASISPLLMLLRGCTAR